MHTVAYGPDYLVDWLQIEPVGSNKSSFGELKPSNPVSAKGLARQDSLKDTGQLEAVRTLVQMGQVPIY